MNVNLGGILGGVIWGGTALLWMLPVEPENGIYAGRVVAIALIIGAFGGNLAWSYYFGKK